MRRRQSQKVRDEVAEYPLFESASDEALEKLCDRATCHDYPENNILAYQGDRITAVFLVIEGRLNLSLQNEEGRKVVLRDAREGDVAGLLPAVGKRPYPANLITATPCRLARFEASTFRYWVLRESGLLKRVVESLSDELEHAYRRIGEHALMGVKERLLSTLLQMAEEEGQPDAAGDAVTFTRPTHRELANRIGSSREVVTRYLKEILESDLLQQEDGRVIRVPESALVLRDEE